MVMRPRNERIVKVINNLLGEALGELFVSKYFPPAAKQTAVEMAQDIVTAYQQRIEQLDWMSDATKAYAIEKLSSIRVKIGFPENGNHMLIWSLSRKDKGPIIWPMF